MATCYMPLSQAFPRLLSRANWNPNGCLTVGTQCKRRYWALAYDGKYHGAHQAAWQFYNGPIPKGLHVLHSCDNPRCINIHHLFLGTPLMNARDREMKGRGRGGRTKGCLCANGSIRRGRKLTPPQVLEIYEMRRLGIPTRQIASQFGVTVVTVRDIAVHKTWSALTLGIADNFTRIHQTKPNQ